MGTPTLTESSSSSTLVVRANQLRDKFLHWVSDSDNPLQIRDELQTLRTLYGSVERPLSLPKVTFKIVAFNHEAPSKKTYRYFNVKIIDVTAYQVSAKSHEFSKLDSLHRLRERIFDYMDDLRSGGVSLRGESLVSDPFSILNVCSHGAEVLRTGNNQLFRYEFPFEWEVERKYGAPFREESTFLVGMRESGESQNFPFKDKHRKSATLVVDAKDLDGKCLQWWSGNMEVCKDSQTFEEIYGTELKRAPSHE